MGKGVNFCEVCKRAYYKDDIDNNEFQFQFEPYNIGFSEALRDKNQFCINICSDECYNIKAIDEQLQIYEMQILYHITIENTPAGTSYDMKLAKEMDEKMDTLNKMQKKLWRQRYREMDCLIEMTTKEFQEKLQFLLSIDYLSNEDIEQLEEIRDGFNELIDDAREKLYEPDDDPLVFF